ncbi:dihydroorotase [Niabella ginsenosidivorans]|uniref:Dihydroorotase n=1 Tax=Niabella ginsenosidivorans TaxID=1176587 RepID=A0A1A9I298_9BACT|nr:dihydroorotase [Niabella ginsenosidivorans]ANH81746.1 dihydroorotase [Niabella ginsenosidivorans]
MNILIKQSRIIDPTSSFNGRTADILIVNGIIQSIGKTISHKGAKIVDGKTLHVSPGWVDLFADFADPGYEYRETLSSGAKAAAAGGFTDVCIVPNTRPALDQKSAIEYILAKAAALPVTIHPLGAVTKNTEGKELAEIYDMRHSGAMAFTDGTNAIQSSDIMVKALQYIKPFKGVLIQVPDNKDIQPQGLVNEGITATRLGLQAKPAIAEELLIARDIKLAQYADSRLHITGITTAASVKLVKEARQKKTDVTVSVTPAHLFFSEEDLVTYDTHLKLNPPLRTINDRKALQKGIADGTIDCIATHHIPYDTDHKTVEFEYAKYGMIGLQTAYAVLRTALPEISQERWVELLAINPRKILGLPVPSIKEGAPASLTVFAPEQKWELHADAILSKSKNSAFMGKQLIGKPLGIIHNNRSHLLL